MKKKLVPISVLVPGLVYDELLREAKARQWSISHLVRFILLETVDAWLRQDYEALDDGPAHEK